MLIHWSTFVLLIKCVLCNALNIQTCVKWNSSTFEHSVVCGSSSDWNNIQYVQQMESNLNLSLISLSYVPHPVGHQVGAPDQEWASLQPQYLWLPFFKLSHLFFCSFTPKQCKHLSILTTKCYIFCSKALSCPCHNFLDNIVSA